MIWNRKEQGGSIVQGALESVFGANPASKKPDNLDEDRLLNNFNANDMYIIYSFY